MKKLSSTIKVNIIIRLLCAVEFGFLCAERGWNLQRTLKEARRHLKGMDDTPKPGVQRSTKRVKKG